MSSSDQENEKRKLTFTVKGAWMGLIAYLVLIAVVAVIMTVG